eukprot:3538147-Pleurochrysis_carterae.AAC.1
MKRSRRSKAMRKGRTEQAHKGGYLVPQREKWSGREGERARRREGGRVRARERESESESERRRGR